MQINMHDNTWILFAFASRSVWISHVVGSVDRKLPIIIIIIIIIMSISISSSVAWHITSRDVASVVALGRCSICAVSAPCWSPPFSRAGQTRTNSTGSAALHSRSPSVHRPRYPAKIPLILAANGLGYVESADRTRTEWCRATTSKKMIMTNT